MRTAITSAHLKLTWRFVAAPHLYPAWHFGHLMWIKYADGGVNSPKSAGNRGPTLTVIGSRLFSFARVSKSYRLAGRQVG